MRGQGIKRFYLLVGLTYCKVGEAGFLFSNKNDRSSVFGQIRKKLVRSCRFRTTVNCHSRNDQVHSSQTMAVPCPHHAQPLLELTHWAGALSQGFNLCFYGYGEKSLLLAPLIEALRKVYTIVKVDYSKIDQATHSRTLLLLLGNLPHGKDYLDAI